VQKGLIRHWGVSNLDTEDMKALMAAGGKNCVTDQVLYHIGSRGVEYDLLPWLKKNRMPMMAYCPLAHTAEKRRKIEAHPIIGEMAERHHVSKAGIMLGFVMQDPMVFTVCKASSIEHVRENCQAAELVFSEAEMKDLDREFAPPHEKVPLDME
jgi:diketogulonate reductase-like aldo/keto reductase